MGTVALPLHENTGKLSGFVVIMNKIIYVQLELFTNFTQ